MDGILDKLILNLQKQLGFHRQLLEQLRIEKDALERFDPREIQNCTLQKETLIHSIQETERERVKLVLEWSVLSTGPEAGIALSALIEKFQVIDLARTEQLRSLQSALVYHIDRVVQLNQENGFLVENGLHHIQKMKTNALGATTAPTAGYTQKGQRALPGSLSEGRLLTEEA